MHNIEILDKILLSDKVLENFYNEYKHNVDFRDWLDTTIPDIKKCMEREQNSPWHIYNVLDHILYSVEGINRMSRHLEYNERRKLAYTMLFHDIGKPDTYVFRKNKGTFYGHHLRSCEITKKLLPIMGFNEGECREILALIYKHDAFIPVSNGQVELNEKFINNQIEYFNKFGDGNKLMGYLIMVSKSDNYAQNPEMVWHSLDVLKAADNLPKKMNNKR